MFGVFCRLMLPCSVFLFFKVFANMTIYIKTKRFLAKNKDFLERSH